MEVYGRIYGIENMLNHKIYVGQTTQTIKERFRQHRNRNSYIGRAIREYGKENFIIVILEECYSREEMNEAEKRWIKRLNCKYPNGYNRNDGGIEGSNPCEDTREQMSILRKKYLAEYPNEMERVSSFRTGTYKPSDETCVKFATSRKIYFFYPNLEAELVKRNLTHRKLARLLGITKSTIHSKLSGKGKISLEMKRAIHEFLQTDLSIEELFWHED